MNTKAGFMTGSIYASHEGMVSWRIESKLL